MARRSAKIDTLFQRAEQLAHDFSLFPQAKERSALHIKGLVPKNDVDTRLEELSRLSVDDYIEQTVMPSEDTSRADVKTTLRRMQGDVLYKIEEGPLYAAEIVLSDNDEKRRVGILAQDRSVNNGVWMPEHHTRAVEIIREFCQHAIPIVAFIDTPGADAGADANHANQAHSISRLIAEMAQIDVPSVGIIFGNGYSGGAIPLATTNILLSVRDGVFNTIQPRGLASIVRKYDLSWQECAKYVGVSAYELYKRGHIDGIIDHVPGERGTAENVRKAIVSSIALIEGRALEFVRRNPYIFDHYRRSMDRYLNPSETLRQIQEIAPLSLSESPTGHLNIFGVAYRYMRYLGMRNKIRSITVERYGRLSEQEIPKGDLQRRAEDERMRAFDEWLSNPLAIRYDDALQRTWNQYQGRKKALPQEASRISRWVFGSPQQRYDTALRRLYLEFGFHLYNQWKAESPGNFLSLISYLLASSASEVDPASKDITVLDVIRSQELRDGFVSQCQNLLFLDTVYDQIVQDLSDIAREAEQFNTIREESVQKILEPALDQAAQRLATRQQLLDTPKADIENRLKELFKAWILDNIDGIRGSTAMKSIETWKKQVFPRVSEPLFAIVTFFIEQLIPQHIEARRTGKRYDGRITPRNIGMKDFWNRLTIAYHDLQIQDLLVKEKRSRRLRARDFVERFFEDFQELYSNMMTADPVQFPGYRISIEQTLSQGVAPCALMTGIGRFKLNGRTVQAGAIISNLEFQAGAIDMASAEKFCHLLLACAERHLPVICFISSGGMQTKEGAGALFSMPIVNDRITRFVRDLDLPIICFGFGDCTGGAQASFVTHPLVHTHYFSCTNMPFAGQIVVPSYLPSRSTLSNYLSEVDGAMQSLVRHPFADDLDERLKEIDPKIPCAAETVEEAVERVLRGDYTVDNAEDDGHDEERPVDETALLRPIQRVLIHARGCPAVKLIHKAQENDIRVVLVQSDADHDSAAADALGEHDALVCIGGNTPDESYLNALSVIRVAERERVDAIHPGIGFLSESAQFADLCRSHGINFIGPPMASMERMGNKSNAINTAIKLDIPVVPGSRGIVTTLRAAKKLAGQIGYPVLIKAVHGGGGKGIKLVEHADDFNDLFTQIAAEAKNAFGSSDVYLEKYIGSMRHVEVQILRDSHGNTQVLGLRDCTVQRNNQKIIEESESVALPQELMEAVIGYSGAIADEIGYMGAGTVEYIYDMEAKVVYFMEMNTRLQIEHPVTEAVTGVDIVAAQFDIASGKSIADMHFEHRGHALEVRVNAEMPVIDARGAIMFRPSPGKITECILPEREGIDIIAGVASGKTVPPFYDNMILQIICSGPDRTTTIDRMVDYLKSVRIRGIPTNIGLLETILTDEIFRAGDYDTGYLKGLLQRVKASALSRPGDDNGDADHPALSADSLKIEGSQELRVVAPSSGLFYLTPSPAEPEFVSEGDVITVDQKICLIEAMKLFTPITLNTFNGDGQVLYPPEHKYRIVKIVPSTGQAINERDLLFVVEPA